MSGCDVASDVQNTSVLQNSAVVMHRSNAERTGVYNSEALKELPSVKWEFRPEHQDPDARNTLPPVAADGTIYYASRGSFRDADGTRRDASALYAIDTETGLEKWIFDAVEKASGIVSSAVAVANGTVYVGVRIGWESGIIYALDAETGQVKWLHETSGAPYSVPAIAENIVYFGTETAAIYALDIETGQELWVYETGYIDTIVFFSLVVSDNEVYFTTDLRKALHVLDAETGERNEDFEGIRVTVGAVSEGVFYKIPSLTAIDLETGVEKWFFSGTEVPPAIVGDTVYIGGNDGNLYAVDAETGQERWRLFVGANISTMVSFAGGYVYVGSDDQEIHAVDAETGQEVWSFSTEGEPWWWGGPIIDAGVLYFISEDATLYALQ